MPNKNTQFKKGYTPWNKGKHHSEEVRAKLREKWVGRKHILTAEGKKSFSEKMSGVNNPKWVSDRTKLKIYSDDNKDRRSSAYGNWRTQIWSRDNFKCRINNSDCKGKIEAHHILSWKDYPELRYEVNNGITLCHAHHPRKRAEEKRLSPYFKKLINQEV